MVGYKVVFFCNYLNHHQVCVADELYGLLGDKFRFVATLPRNAQELKGGQDYSTRPYCILAGESEEAHDEAVKCAKTAEVCVFGACSQPYALLRDNGLSFECGERWLKRGWLNVLSPVLLRWWRNYMTHYRHRDFYKLCASAYAAKDDRKLGCYKGRHYRWGYFTGAPDVDTETANPRREGGSVRMMWCARFLDWKHPELPVLMAERLRARGYDFSLDYYGSGEEEEATKALAAAKGLDGVVTFHGAVSNGQVLAAMAQHDIFLFTSDANEGWGAVANEAMGQGCVLVGSDAIGSVPYLVRDGENGTVFESCDVEDLASKVEWLLQHPREMEEMKRNAVTTMREVWSPANAARNFLQLAEDLANHRESSVQEGPGSRD